MTAKFSCYPVDIDRELLRQYRTPVKPAMLDDNDFRRVVPNIDAVDPIGAIRIRARELWRSDGSPREVDLKSLFERAESEVLGAAGRQSRGAIASAERQVRKINASVIDSELAKLAASSGPPLLRVIIEAIRERPNEHEAICLARLLHSNALVLADQSRIERQTIPAIAELLADIAGEYPEEFLKQHKAADFRTIPRQQRADFWSEKFSRLLDVDEPLTFNSRLTIMRYVSLLRASCLVSDVHFEG